MEVPTAGAQCAVEGCGQLVADLLLFDDGPWTADLADFLPVRCGACGLQTCNAHRSYTAHACPSLTAPPATGDAAAGAQPQPHASAPVASVFPDRSRFEPVPRAPVRTAPLRATPREGEVAPPAPPRKVNRQLELMRLKQRAQGDAGIPMAARLHLSVHGPSAEGTTAAPAAVYFDRERSVGWVLDRLAAQLHLDNVNNRADQAARHLVLYHGDTGVALPLDRPLGDAQVALVDGGSVILERGAGPRVDPSLYSSR